MNKLNAIIILILVIGVSALAYIGLNPTQTSSSSQNQNEVNINPELLNDPSIKEYKQKVTYKIPEEKTEDLTLSIKLNDEGIIVDSNVTFTVNERVSLQYQTDFTKNYKAQIIGKNIKDINLSRVGSASLSTKAFNEAINIINSKL